MLADSEPLEISDLPNEIKLAGTQLPNFIREETKFKTFWEWGVELERRSYGVVVNSFYELEPAYADHYRNSLEIKSSHIGPIFQCNKDTNASSNEHECLKWLTQRCPIL